MSDLCLAHVGQRLFEMLWRSCGMAWGQLAGISKHKSDSEEHYTTTEGGGLVQKRGSQTNSTLCFHTESCFEVLEIRKMSN